MYKKNTRQFRKNNLIIDYPVKIHWTYNCTCQRISQILIEEAIDNRNEINCVLEKMCASNRFCRFLCIADKVTLLNSLYYPFMESRINLINYFKKYEWSPDQSTIIRRIVQTINSICFCNNNLVTNKLTSNAGFVIIGNRNQMEKISHCFNKYTKKTAFSTAYYIKLNSLGNIDNRDMDHTLERFTRSPEYLLLKQNDYLYTLIGLQLPVHLKKWKGIYGFPFGKREWYNDIFESSFDCAKRELYEEFNIQFSQSLWKYNTNLGLPQYIYTSGFILYILYLSNNTLIGYHSQSDTIYLDKSIRTSNNY